MNKKNKELMEKENEKLKLNNDRCEEILTIVRTDNDRCLELQNKELKYFQNNDKIISKIHNYIYIVGMLLLIKPIFYNNLNLFFQIFSYVELGVFLGTVTLFSKDAFQNKMHKLMIAKNEEIRKLDNELKAINERCHKLRKEYIELKEEEKLILDNMKNLSLEMSKNIDTEVSLLLNEKEERNIVVPRVVSLDNPKKLVRKK